MLREKNQAAWIHTEQADIANVLFYSNAAGFDEVWNFTPDAERVSAKSATWNSRKSSLSIVFKAILHTVRVITPSRSAVQTVG